MTQTFNGCRVAQLHDTIRVGVWVQETMHGNVSQVHQIDPDGKRVELVSDHPGRGPIWVPFWMIDSSYRQVGR